MFFFLAAPRKAFGLLVSVQAPSSERGARAVGLVHETEVDGEHLGIDQGSSRTSIQPKIGQPKTWMAGFEVSLRVTWR